MEKERIQFFKVLVDNFLDRLWMPPDFVERVMRDLPSHVLLTTNTQRTWSVQLLKTNQGVFFGEGWKEFAEYHKLQEKEFLTFTYYSGKDYLKVRVFAKDGFERKFVSEEVKPEKIKEKVGKSCMRGRISSRLLNKNFIRNTNLPAHGSAHGMTYKRNFKEKKVVHSGNCGSDQEPRKANENDVVATCSGKKKIPTHCVNNKPADSESSYSMEDEPHLKRQKIMRNENRSSPVTEISDKETIVCDAIANDNYYTKRSGATVSSAQSDYFDFVVKSKRLRPDNFQQLYIPRTFYRKHLHSKRQVKLCYGNDRDGKDFLVLKKQYHAGTIHFFTSFCKHHNLKSGDECRFEHVRDSIFKVWKINA